MVEVARWACREDAVGHCESPRHAGAGVPAEYQEALVYVDHRPLQPHYDLWKTCRECHEETAVIYAKETTKEIPDGP